jgi:hypothetical protein
MQIVIIYTVQPQQLVLADPGGLALAVPGIQVGHRCIDSLELCLAATQLVYKDAASEKTSNKYL